MDVSTVAIEVPAAQAEKDDYNSLIGEKGIFNVGLTEAGVKKVADNGGEAIVSLAFEVPKNKENEGIPGGRHQDARP